MLCNDGINMCEIEYIMCEDISDSCIGYYQKYDILYKQIMHILKRGP